MQSSRTISPHSKVPMTEEVRKRYPKDYFTKRPRKVTPFSFMKPITRTIDRTETIAYDRSGRPLMVARMQRRRPNPIVMTAFPLKKNPNKILLCADHGNPWRLQVFFYTDRPHSVCISCNGDFIKIPIESLKTVMKGIRQYLKTVQGDVI